MKGSPSPVMPDLGGAAWPLPSWAPAAEPASVPATCD
jgi:hypothetical protein